MAGDKKVLHPRNYHNSRYDFPKLIESEESLKKYVSLNKYNDLSIDFSNPDAVLSLNKALLSHFYNIKWSIPNEYLCPPIPGRADYIHYLADLLYSTISKETKIKGLDIGVGANAIYPIIGSCVYNWSFVASDIDVKSIENVEKLLKENSSLSNNLELRVQKDKSKIFKNIINTEDKFHFTLCNPPFHKSAQEAQKGSNRKVSNLTKKKVKNASLNFAGKSNELWCEGGEIKFIQNMIFESQEYKNQCLWFTTLVSKKDNLDKIYSFLKKAKVLNIKTIDMKQGQKISRFVAWTYLSKKEQKEWIND